jgi:hypothetical protein
MNPETPEKNPKKLGPTPLSTLNISDSSNQISNYQISNKQQYQYYHYSLQLPWYLLFTKENTRPMEFTLEVGRLEMIGSYPDSIALHHSDATKSMLPRLKGILLQGVATAKRDSLKGP